MTGEVVCPSCGRGNERRTAETYRICVHCGGDLGAALAGGGSVDVREASLQPPQPYGAPPPGAPPQGPQPYAGQPYPPPPYPPPPYYGGPPPPGMWPPTYHPGVYEKPQREPYLDIGNLFRSLFHPKEAFEDLYDHTGSSQGVVLAVLFILVGAGISVTATYAVLGTLDLPEGATSPAYGSTSAVTEVVGVVLSLVLFFLAAYIVFYLLQGKGRHPSLEKTIGLMGYAKFPAFIIGVILAISMPLVLSTMDLDELENADPEDVGNILGAVCGLLALTLGLGAVGFIWSSWVHSHAQSVANDVSVGTAFGYVLVAWIIIGIISIAVTTMVTLLVGLNGGI